MPAVTPSPDANAVRIHKGLVLQPHGAVALIGKFLRPETQMNRLFEDVPAPRGTTIIQRKNNKTLLRHHLVPQESAAGPRVQDHLRVRSAVGVHDDWIFLRG